MALVLALTKGVETATSVIISDSTGDYNVSTNPSGWGIPNIVRGDSNLGLVATYKKSDEDVPLVVTILTPTSGTPLNVTSWSIALEGAGWVKLTQFVAPDYDEALAYEQYSVIWDTTTELFYYWGEEADSTPGAFLISNGWVELTDAQIVDLSPQVEADGFYINSDNQFFTVSIDVGMVQNSIDFTKAAKCDATNKCLLAFKIFTYKIAGQSLSAAGDYITGQTIIEADENIIESSDSSCNC
jgi:hypothetical protein